MAKAKKQPKAELLLEETTKEPSKMDITMKSLEGTYGKGVVIGGKDKLNYTDVISTGSVGLDWALGIGGLPRGKIVEFIGWESSGKSTLTLHLIAEAQKKGLKCLLVDGENGFDAKYAKALGVNPENMLYAQMSEKGGEGAYDVAAKLIRTGDIHVCIIDSVNALQPKKVILEGITASTMGLHSRLMGQVCPQFNVLSEQYNCLCIFISQFREKIGVMFGSPETTQGGNALKFYAHMRLEIRRSVLKEGKEAYANQTRVKVIKNKMAIPFKTAKFNINFGEGIDRIDEILSLGASTGKLRKYGETITVLGPKEEKYNIDVFSSMLRDNPEFYEELKNSITPELDKIQIIDEKEETK